MKMRYLLVASLLTLAISVPAQARTYEHGALSQSYEGKVGREIAAPPAAAAGPIEDDFQLHHPLNFHVIQINACLMAPAVDRI
jgi:hypothetical protein